MTQKKKENIEQIEELGYKKSLLATEFVNMSTQ